ncbi:MAG: hypothetical protein M3Y64_07795, partial [Gemmatimonadota bacterium]|nr:hypothetical protein [Gemmatimonadota bacterium]
MSIARAVVLTAAILVAPASFVPTATPQSARDTTTASHGVTSRAVAPIVDSLRILYIGRPAGWEHYELKQTDGGYMLTSDYDYVDRGRRNHSQLTLTTGRDYALKTYEAARLTDSGRTVTTTIAFDGTHANVVRGGKSVAIAIPAVAYAVSSYSPTAEDLPLIRYWESHGLPKTIAF